MKAVSSISSLLFNFSFMGVYKQIWIKLLSADNIGPLINLPDVQDPHNSSIVKTTTFWKDGTCFGFKTVGFVKTVLATISQTHLFTSPWGLCCQIEQRNLCTYFPPLLFFLQYFLLISNQHSASCLNMASLSAQI